MHNMNHYSVLKKEEIPAICNCNTDGPRRHYAKWNKSDTERNTLNDFYLYFGSKIVKHIEQRVEWWFPGTKQKNGTTGKHNRKHDHRVEMNGNLYLCITNVWHFLNLILYVVKYI